MCHSLTAARPQKSQCHTELYQQKPGASIQRTAVKQHPCETFFIMFFCQFIYSQIVCCSFLLEFRRLYKSLLNSPNVIEIVFDDANQMTKTFLLTLQVLQTSNKHHLLLLLPQLLLLSSRVM